MTDATDRLPLAADFPPASRAQWLALVDQLLKGASFERTMVARTYDGLAIQPLYAGTTQVHARPGRTPGAPWTILQRLDHPDPTAAAEEASNDIRNGANGLSLVLAGSTGAYGYGLAGDQASVRRALTGIALDTPGYGFELDCGAQADVAARAMLSLARERTIVPGIPVIRFGFDPIGVMAHTGERVQWSEAAARLGNNIAALAGAGCTGPFAVADARMVHNAGGSEAQELAFALAVALTYLRALEESGIARERTRKMIYFRLSADADQFLTIAKFRALRDLWGRIEEACGLAPEPIHISAETAWRMMTQRDPYANMLRATIAVFAAGVGGADAITVLPFTLARGLPNRFARRIARNTQLILVEESHLARVSDATAGAGVIDDLIAQLSGAAWKLFQDIERAGGAVAALEQGLIQKAIAAVRGGRQAALARGADTLVGTSEFADLDEAAVAVLDVPPSAPPTCAAPAFEPLPCTRLAEPFERLRDASDRMAAAGTRPKIFLANLGPTADFSGRAAFARNFFEAGGIAAMTNDGFADTAGATDLIALVAAFKHAGTPLACLCGSNEAYAQEAVAAVKALGTAGALHLYCAGRPDPKLAHAGVATFIHAGCDTLPILQAAQQQFAARPR
jgi:methylmalonyl-CoA mutase